MVVYRLIFWLMTVLVMTVLRCGQASAPKRIHAEDLEEEAGTRWAVLVAGSKGYENYRHQADVCHAYQILKKGGLKDENIVVFMYDDIATSGVNPRPGVIINHPNGSDVYAGVPKDYTGENVTAENLYAVLLGDKGGVRGGSGKVLASKPNDMIFFYYSDHGGPGVIGMPNPPYVYANDLIEVLKKMHMEGTYKEMVMYIEACQSGSLFEGLMPKDLNIYVTTASNAKEDSWATYCPDTNPSPPGPTLEYMTCLGDLFSVAWMEDSETHNLERETIDQQYKTVKARTSNHNTYLDGSHVMEYGSMNIKDESLSLYQGFDPSTENLPPNNINLNNEVVNQKDAHLLFMWHRYKRSNKAEILKQINETITHRMYLDSSVNAIGVFLFGPTNPPILSSVRKSGLPLVDDWKCLKSMVRIFESHCGSLTHYGMKHMRAFANMCNNRVSEAEMEVACVYVCSNYNNLGKWSPLIGGYSA